MAEPEENRALVFGEHPQRGHDDQEQPHQDRTDSDASPHLNLQFGSVAVPGGGAVVTDESCAVGRPATSIHLWCA
jgi:hypothetical protein